jgi:prevent-host-death family protein
MRHEIIAISTAKSKLLELSRKVEEEGRAYILTRGGVPRGVLVPMESYESMLETEDVLNSESTMAALKRALADEKSGRLWRRESGRTAKWVRRAKR